MVAIAERQDFVSVTPLLKQLATLSGAMKATPKDIAAAVTLIFENRISPIQFSLLLWALHTTGMDHNPEVLATTAAYMRSAAAQVDRSALHNAVSSKAKPEGNYHGGLVRSNLARGACILAHKMDRLISSVQAVMATTLSTFLRHPQS